MEKKRVVYSGIQPSGMTLGHYVARCATGAKCRRSLTVSTAL